MILISLGSNANHMPWNGNFLKDMKITLPTSNERVVGIKGSDIADIKIKLQTLVLGGMLMGSIPGVGARVGRDAREKNEHCNQASP